MESNELLASLAKMEASLNEVDSARKQVESTVKASSELQKEVKEYVSAVKALCVSLQSWEDDLRVREGHLSHEYEETISRVNTTCNEIINSFGVEVEKTSTDFKNKTNPIAEKFTEQIGKLEKNVQELTALRDEIKKTTGEIESVKETLTQISKDLKDFQDGQNAVLNDIKQTVSEIPRIIGNNAQSIIERIESLNQGLSADIASLQGKADILNSELLAVKSLCHDIKSATDRLNSYMQSLKESLISEIASSKEATLKSININRWLIVAGIIILAFLQYVFK